MDSLPWYVTGSLIGLTVPALLILAEKTFGISASLRHICSISSPKSKLPYLAQNNWRAETWNLFFALGIVLGGFIAARFLSSQTVRLLPDDYYSISGMIKLLVGGIFIGFGARYANGCTSGNTIMGLSTLQVSSLIATVCFFIGGLLMTWLFLG